MRVFFIAPYPTEGPSSRFRVEQYLPELKKRAIGYSLRPFYNSHIYKTIYKKGNLFKKAFFFLFFILRRFQDVFLSRNYDIIFIHREAYPLSGVFFEWLFRSFAKKVIYDFDDSVFLKKPSKIRYIINKSNLVIAGNSFLKDYALRYNKNTIVLPTCINTQIYYPKLKTSSKQKTIIGWIGTSFTSIYLELLRGVYESLAGKYRENIELKVVGGYLPNSHLPLIYKDWSLESEVSELQEFDIGVMPLFDDDWAKGKCAFKILQYMAVGIPAAASSVGMNKEIIEDGKDGFLVKTKEEWVDRLSLLIENKDLREKMGRFGREKVERLYSVEINAQKFIDILEKTQNSRM